MMPAPGMLTFTFDNGTEQTLELDAILSQQHSLDADVTQYPVEKGVSPTDHIQPKAEVFQLEAMIAEWRLGDPPPPTIGPPSPPTRVPEAVNALINIRDTGTLVNFVSQKRSVKSLALSGLKMTFDAKMGNALRFSCNLTQVRIVETRTAAVIKKKTATPNGKKKVDEGSKPTTPADNNTLLLSAVKPGLKAIGLISTAGP